MDNRNGDHEPGAELLDTYLERLQALAKGTFWELLGCQLVSASHDRVTVTLQVENHHLNNIGILHGGVHASLLDNTMGIAAMLARPNEKVVTTNLSMHYLAPLRKGTVTVSGLIIHETRSILTTQGEIHDESGVLGSWGSASYRVST